MIFSSCRNREPLMNTSVTGALWQQCRFPLLLIPKALKAFLQGKAIASMVKNVTKTLYLRRTRWAAGESRALQSSCWAKSLPWMWEQSCIFYRTMLSSSEQGQNSTWGWNRFAAPALSCTATDTAKCDSLQANDLHFFDVTCLESCHQLAHTLRHCVPRLGTQMTAELRQLPACTPGLLLASEWLPTPQPHPREQDFLAKHPSMVLFLINALKQLLSTSLKPYACYIHKSTFSPKIFKLKLLINPLWWSRWIRQLPIRTPFC